MTEKWIVDDCGTLINMETRDTFDYVPDVCDLLNKQEDLINTLREELELADNETTRLEEEKIKLEIKLQKIRDYATEDGVVKQGVIEKVVFE